MSSIIRPTIILHATQKKKYDKFSMTYHQLCGAVSEITWGEKNVLSVYFPKLDDQIHKSKHSLCFTHFCEHSSWHAVEVQEEVLDGYTNNAKMAHTTCLHNSAVRINHTALPKGKGTGRTFRLPGAWKESRGRCWQAQWCPSWPPTEHLHCNGPQEPHTQPVWNGISLLPSHPPYLGLNCVFLL